MRDGSKIVRVGWSFWWLYLLAGMSGVGALVTLIGGAFGPVPRIAALVAFGEVCLALLLCRLARYLPAKLKPILLLTANHLELPRTCSIPWRFLKKAGTVEILGATYLGFDLTENAKQQVTIPKSLAAASFLPRVASFGSYEYLLLADSWDELASEVACEINRRIDASRDEPSDNCSST